MLPSTSSEGVLLVLDTCAEDATLALFEGSNLLEEVQLPPRAASTALLGAMRGLLEKQGLRLAQLEGVGVVSGPGSFTGVRIGMAAAKGICEAIGRPLAAVSRLEVLADAAQVSDGIVLLGAGRDQVYVRELAAGDSATREWLSNLEELKPLLIAGAVIAGSPELQQTLAGLGAAVVSQETSAKDAIVAVRRCLALGGSDLITSDANYVRNEATIYARSAASR